MNNRRNIIVAGIGTHVGKTVVSAILTTALKADYWKPIECGDSDTATMQRLLDPTQHILHPPAYSFKIPASPHHAARLEKKIIDLSKIAPPQTERPLIIESVGGLYVPLNLATHTLDLFKKWQAQWIVVSKHYLGSINHTLLTLEALKRNQLPVIGVVLNGRPNRDSEAAIFALSGIPCIGRVLPEIHINRDTIARYAKQWPSL